MGSFDAKMTLTIRKEFYIITFILVCKSKLKFCHIYMLIPFFGAFFQSPQELETDFLYVRREKKKLICYK